MSTLPTVVLEDCLALSQKVNDHNFDIARAGGAFGADNFRESLRKRIQEIQKNVGTLAGAVRFEAIKAKPIATD